MLSVWHCSWAAEGAPQTQSDDDESISPPGPCRGDADALVCEVPLSCFLRDLSNLRTPFVFSGRGPVKGRCPCPLCRQRAESQGWVSLSSLGPQVLSPCHRNLLLCGFQGLSGRAVCGLKPGPALFFFHILGLGGWGGGVSPGTERRAQKHWGGGEREGGEEGKQADNFLEG